jgi:hypothetical protein
MIEVAQDVPRFAAPDDPAVRNVEGWILGMRTESEPMGSALPETRMRPARSGSGPSDVVPVLQIGDGQGRICPACGQKRFVRWPWGWDAPAAHSCTGVQGETRWVIRIRLALKRLSEPDYGRVPDLDRTWSHSYGATPEPD